MSDVIGFLNVDFYMVIFKFFHGNVNKLQAFMIYFTSTFEHNLCTHGSHLFSLCNLYEINKKSFEYITDMMSDNSYLYIP